MGKWEMVRLGDVCLDTEKVNPTTYDKEITYIDISAINSDIKKITEYNAISSQNAPSRARQLIQQGDILVSTVRPNLNAVAIVEKTDNEMIASTGFCVLRPDKGKVDNKYLFEFVKSTGFVRSMTMQATGASYPAVSNKIVMGERIPLPPLPVQQKIADVLDHANALIEKRKAQMEKLDLLVKSQFIQMFGTANGNENGFPLLTVDDVIKFEGGSQPPRSTFESVPTEENIRLIQIRDYKTDEYMTYIPKSLARKFCTADDIMIGRYGPPIFQILQGLEGAYNVALLKAVPKMGNREFVREYLRQKPLLEYLESLSQRTAGQTGIDMDALKKYPFPYPPIELQESFAEFLKAADKSKLAMRQALEKQQRLYQSLMQKCFNGEMF